jgi:HAD superfamily hydrolase (TIGR01509 family)
MNRYPFDAIIFDLDGTLIDTETPDFEACKTLFTEYGAILTVEHWADLIVGHMDGYDYLFEELIRQGNNGVAKTDLWKRHRQLWTEFLLSTQLMPGVDSLLPKLQTLGFRMAVATASDRKWAVRWLSHFDLLPYFPVVASSDDIIHNKPAPDVYLFAAAKLKVQPDRCLVFEDSVAGVRAAKGAGMTVIAVPSQVTKSLNFSQSDGIMHGLQNITLDWLNSLADIDRKTLTA